MKNCWKHPACGPGPIQGPSDIYVVLQCMLERDILVEVDGKYITSRTDRNRWSIRKA